MIKDDNTEFPVSNTKAVDYESFGARGDGKTDDMAAICRAHSYANKHQLPVCSRPDAVYHLGGRALTAIICTDTDWNSSRFIVDDTNVENHKARLFEVRSQLPPVDLSLKSLKRDQQRLDVSVPCDCHVVVENDAQRRYIRRGLNRSAGSVQRDNFILRVDGSIASPIDWDYDRFSHIQARPIDPVRLTLRGGVFTTIANRMKRDTGYNYWGRNIEISRSNTEVDGLTHHVTGEKKVGQPYRGFLLSRRCADITLRNCFATGHRIYWTIGNAGKPVKMGSYDYAAKEVTNFRMCGCRMDHINDRRRWGVIETSFCRNVCLEDCVLSRMDTHMGISGFYTVRRCTLGHMGLNAIGRGLLTVEESTLYGKHLVNFRPDYGSTWEGDLVIRDSRWIPACGRRIWPRMIGLSNDGAHDFGYPCAMPRQITIERVEVDDANHPEDYQGLYILSDPAAVNDGLDAADATSKLPFAYQTCQKVTVRDLRTASGKPPQLSPDPLLSSQISFDID